MSYLSLISCTDRETVCVATRIRSAYSSVSKRETSFSRIAHDSPMRINSAIYPVLGFDTRGPPGGRPLREPARRPIGSHDRPQIRLRDAGRKIPGQAEEPGVGFRAVQDHGSVDRLEVEHEPGEDLQFRRGSDMRRREPDEHVFRAPD